MALENLKENISHEKQLVKQLFDIYNKREQMNKSGNINNVEINMINDGINSMVNQIKIVNNSIPRLLNNISAAKKLPVVGKFKTPENQVRVSYQVPGRNQSLVTINKEDKGKFLTELHIDYKILRKITGKREKEKEHFEFKKPSKYAKISNKIFLSTSNSLVKKYGFNSLNNDLRKANIPYLINTYISMGLFTSLLSFFVGIFWFVFSLIFSISFSSPFISFATITAQGILINALIIIGLPALTLGAFYMYPSGEKNGLRKRIDSEVPFVAIHMSAIAGSGIEPSKIFRIIAINDDYKYTGEELKKIINQVNVYGYDLVNAMRNTAKTTSSKRLADLLNGFATTISSGGSLNKFLDKKAETLLFDYRMDREKYTKVAETFMDVYISIIIAAPMIMMMLMILISVTGFDIGISVEVLSVIIVLVVAVINILFLSVLHLKQPTY